jgi:cytochrome c oxidase subunit 1
VFLAAWTATMIMVLIVYPHHLLMDFAMPVWALVMGQVISYASGLPVLAVTMIGTLAIVYRSGLRWDMVSGLLFLSVFGWAAGVLPAIIDATIVANSVMHNTLWVPGHFHFYLVLGLVAMLLAFAYHLAKSRGGLQRHGLDALSFWTFAVAGLGLAGTFLLSGRHSIPRRWAVHLPEWVPYDRIGSLFAALVVAAVLVFTVRFLTRLGAMARPA